MLKNLIITMLLTFILFPNTSKANEEIVIPTDSWPPFRIVTDNSYEGIDFDLLNEIEKKTNLKLIYKRYPWSRSLIYMKNGSVDLMSGLAKRAEREEYIQYTSPSYYTCSTVFYVQKGLGDTIKTYDDLKKYLIGYVSNSAYFAPFDSDTSLKKRAVTTESQLIKMLAAGRLKVMIGTDCQVDYDIAKLGFNGQFEKALYKPHNEVNLYIGISKKSPFINDIEKINKAIEEIIKEGKIKEFAKKYYE